ncbi:class I SAM-dependent methyltransferase [Winogradskyella echinorum]|nr:class I SAM-dependent methyltransferase [Winogradskyella echinorum]
MTYLYDIEKRFEYENGFYATADPSRFSKFISHLEFFKRTSEVRGEIVEFGVFNGNSFFRWIKFRDLLEQTSSRKIICFDIFGDFPEANYEEDKLKRDSFVEETKGGITILDDYGAFAGTNKAVDDKVQVRKLPYLKAISYIVK